MKVPAKVPQYLASLSTPPLQGAFPLHMRQRSLYFRSNDH